MISSVEPNAEFQSFSKISRFNRRVVVTEKIDGTNAQIYISDGGSFFTGSRNRWITPEQDNYGFSRWAHDHKDELMELGPGRHFGEWWGSGIQRRYGLTGGDRRFSMFNVSRWVLHGVTPTNGENVLPECVGLVPVLWCGMMEDMDVEDILVRLFDRGSVASPGFMDPEGIVIFHEASGTLFKKTIKNDDTPKSAVSA